MGKRNFRRLLKWCLLVFGVLLLVCGLLAQHVWRHYLQPERLRVLAEGQLADLSGADVTIEQARFSLTSGIRLRNVQITERAPHGNKPTIQVQDVILHPSWTPLLRGRLALRAAEFDGVELNARFEPSGRWMFMEGIKPLPAGTGPGPKIIIRGGNLHATGLRAQLGVDKVDLNEIDLTLRPRSRAAQTYDLTIRSGDARLGMPEMTAALSAADSSAEGTLRLHNIVLDEKFRARLPDLARAPLEQFGLNTANLDAAISFRFAPEKPLHLEGNFDLRGANICPKAFPYPFTQLRMSAHFDDRKFEIKSLSAVAGNGRLAGNGSGEVKATGKLVGQFSFRAEDLRLDDVLYHALPEKEQGFWRECKPSGNTNFSARIRLTEDSDKPAVEAQLEMKDWAIAPPAAPMAMTNLRGTLQVYPDRIATREVTGRIGEGTIQLADCSFSFEKGGPFALNGEARDLKLDEQLERWVIATFQIPIEDPAAAFVLKGSVTGALDVWSFNVERPKKDGDIRFSTQAGVKELAFAHPAIKYPFRSPLIRFKLDNKSLELRPMSFTFGKTGTIQTDEAALDLAPGAPNQFSFHVRDLPLDDAPFYLLPQVTQQVLTHYDASGIGEGDVVLERTAKPGAPLHYLTRIRFHKANFRFDGFPYAVTDGEAEMEVVDDWMTYATLSGKNGDARVRLAVTEDRFTDMPGYRVQVDGEKVALSDQFRAALTSEWQSRWDAAKPKGVADVRVIYRTPEQRTEGPHFWCRVAIVPHDIVLVGTVPLEADGGQIVIEQAANDESGGFPARGTIEIKKFAIDRKAVSDLSAVFRSDATRVYFEKLAATSYGGKVTASLSIPTTDEDDIRDASPGETKGEIVLTDADLTAIAKQYQIKDMSGILTASTAFTIRGESMATLLANGKLQIREGQIGKLPWVLAILNLFHLNWVDAPAFSRIELDYEMAGRTMHARRFDLIGKVISLLGSGELRTDGTIDLVFEPRFGPQVNIPILTPAWRYLKKSVMPVAVHGSVNDPVWQMNPLFVLPRTIESVLRGLLPWDIFVTKPAEKR